MKHIMIRIAGGMVAAFGIIVNRGHADVNNCTTWTNETAGNLNYKKCSYNSDGGGYRYFASWSSVPTGSNALAPARETCMNAMGTIDYPGCKNGRCNQTGIVCEDTGLLFSVGCCLASPSYGQPGACATNATGCRVQVMPIEAANYTYYRFNSCANGYYTPTNLGGTCTGTYSSLESITACCAQCSGYQNINGQWVTVNGASGSTSGIFINTSTTPGMGITTCLASMSLGPITAKDNSGTYDLMGFVDANNPGTYTSGCYYSE